MAKLQIWSSGVGLGALIFYLAAVAGGFLSAYFFWLPTYRSLIGLELEIFALIMMIVMFAGTGFGAIAVLFSIFGIPKIMWIIFALLTLACVIATAIVVTVAFEGHFVYINLAWYQGSTETMFDFLGFWLAAGGSLLAFILGIFVPVKY